MDAATRSRGSRGSLSDRAAHDTSAPEPPRRVSAIGAAQSNGEDAYRPTESPHADARGADRPDPIPDSVRAFRERQGAADLDPATGRTTSGPRPCPIPTDSETPTR
jgi:hypothetical protein